MINIETDFDFYMSCLEQATGRDRECLLERRSYPLSYYRAFVAQSLKADGYSSVEIGRLLNRDHSTVLVGLRQLKVALSTRGYEDIISVWTLYLAEIAKRRSCVRPMEVLAREFVGKHCNRVCGLCDIKMDECRYLNEERIFIAGCEAYKGRLKEALEEFRIKTAGCALICGRDDIQETIANLEALIND